MPKMQTIKRSVTDYQGGYRGILNEESEEFVEDDNPGNRSPETLDGDCAYCDSCVEEASQNWWKEEQKTYLHDEAGYTPNDEEYGRF